MKKYLTTITALLVFIPCVAFAQTSSLWKVLSNVLQPVLSTWSLEMPSLGGGGTQCVQVNNSGLFQVSGAGCGGGGGTNFWTNSGSNTYLNTGTNAEFPTFTATSTDGTSSVNGGNNPLIIYPTGVNDNIVINGFPERITLGGSTDSPSNAESMFRLDTISQGQYGGNQTVQSWNAYEGTSGTLPSPYVIMGTWDGLDWDNPGTQQSFSYFGVRPYGYGLIGGLSGITVEASGGGHGVVSAGTLESGVASGIFGYGTIQDDGSGNVSGVGTFFTQQIKPQDSLCANDTGDCGIVIVVTDDNDLVVSPPMINTTSPDSYTIYKPYINITNSCCDSFFNVAQDGDTNVKNSLFIGGNISVGGTFSSDSGQVNTDGTGSMTMANLLTTNNIVSQNELQVSGSTSLDGGNITTDDAGNMTTVGNFIANSATSKVEIATSSSIYPFSVGSTTASIENFAVDFKGNQYGGGGKPSVSCASTCTLDAHAHDSSGIIFLSGVQTSVTLTFYTAKPWAPHCVASDNVTSGNYDASSTLTTLVMSTAVSLGTASISYNCQQ